MEKVFVDTNVFLRYLTKDDPLKYERCTEVFKRAQQGDVILTTSAMVIAELVWTLLAYYKVPKSEVVQKVSIIVNTEFLRIPEKEIIADALVLYGRKDIDYIDAYNVIFMRLQGVSKICTYDSDFEAIEGLQKEEP
ncbi:MAG: type II toxin-antitoxin system VapC family toxin [Deltaproteobacteria bacterium]|nr:MAG: type II toxin-antitoxin system VapC family toxin [Deltaproteobacteria bacterium]